MIENGNSIQVLLGRIPLARRQIVPANTSTSKHVMHHVRSAGNLYIHIGMRVCPAIYGCNFGSSFRRSKIQALFNFYTYIHIKYFILAKTLWLLQINLQFIDKINRDLWNINYI